MSSAPVPAPLEFDIGPVLTRGFGAFFRNLPALVVMAVIVYAPLIAFAFLGRVPAEADTLAEATWLQLRFTLVMAVGGMVLSSLLAGAVTYAVVEELAARRAGVGASLRVGLARLLPALGVGLLAGLAILGGSLLLVIPGLMVACAYYVALPVAVIERPGVVASLRRSAELTRGRRWWILALMMVSGAISGVVVTLVELAVIDRIGAGFDAIVVADDWFLYVSIQVANWVLSGALGAVLGATAYVGLRNTRDGVGIADLARVFD